jgi:hypothetical protein
MMRTAQWLKLFTHGVLVFGLGLAFKFFNLTSFAFWLVVFASILLWLVLRLFASVGQLVYETRNDSARIWANIERSIYESNALTREIRDLIDSNGVEKIP